MKIPTLPRLLALGLALTFTGTACKHKSYVTPLPHGTGSATGTGGGTDLPPGPTISPDAGPGGSSVSLSGVSTADFDLSQYNQDRAALAAHTVHFDYDSAAILWKKMQGPYSARYLPLGDLWLDFTAKDSVTSSYYRDLDLNNATTTVKYTINGITYRRETFISYPDKLMVIRISADKKGAVGFTASLSSKLKYKVDATAAGGLILKGKAPKFVANRDYEPKQVEYDDNPMAKE